MHGQSGNGVIARETFAMPVIIRFCRADDLPALEWYGLYTPHREIIRTAFQAQERGDAVMLVAEVRGFPAAQAWIDFARKRAQGIATLWALRVFPPFRRAGLGRALMRAAERVVLAWDVPVMELGVDRDNAAVLDFYESLGFEPAGNERGTYTYRTPDGQRVDVPIDQWLLRKDLDQGRPRRAAR